MSRRVFLHVGAPKTGTTYLQARLEANARTLAAAGVHVPGGTPLVPASRLHFRAALDLLDQDWGGQPGHAEGGWDTLVRKVRRRSGTVVVSHEILAPAPAAAIARAQADLGAGRGTELHVVYTVRDLARQVPAAWQESLKQGKRLGYADFVQRFTRGRRWFARAIDLPGVLGAWSSGLPPERVHVVTVPPRGAPRDVLWHRFLETVGADPAAAVLDTESVNNSLGVVECAVLRRLNRRLGRSTWDDSYDGMVRHMLLQGTLLDSRSAPVRLPDDLLPWAQDRTQRWLDWIEGSGVDVVGDLADLTPLPRAEGERYVDPDRVSAKRQLKVAMGALAAMTHEAARRDDPDRQIVARARSAARRLPSR